MRLRGGTRRLGRQLSILMVLALTISAAAAMLGYFASPGGAASPYGSGTIAIIAPGSPQPLNAPFQVQGSLTVFAPHNSPTWGGYDFELAYDNAVLQATDDARGICTSSGWGPIALAPHVVSGCGLQSTAATGVLENITFHCIANASTPLRLIPRNDPEVEQVGTALFDENGIDFDTTLVNSSVTCGTPPTATPTNTATATNTPPATNTPTVTPTGTIVPTNTPIPPTNTPGPPTNTPSATATGIVSTPTGLPTVVPRGCVIGDTDCDGCPDLSEPMLTPPTDPTNPWDFYSVPVPAIFAAASPGVVFKDANVMASDAQAVFAYFRIGARTGTAEYDADQNQNGTKDGVEYDRTVVGPGRSGAPDGVITAQDAQLAFAQFKLGYHCGP